jgi:hypothetical protein
VLWESVNVTLNPELKEKLIERELFRFHCPACGVTSELVFPLLYHDQQRKVMIWLLIPDENDQVALDRASIEMAKEALKGYILRLVTSTNILIEKILIFDAFLDDRVIELLKTLLVQEADLEAGFARDLLFFKGLVEGAGAGKRLTFVQLRPAEEPLAFDVGWENGYQAIKALLHGEYGEPRIEETHWRIVDRVFGEQFVSRGPAKSSKI